MRFIIARMPFAVYRRRPTASSGRHDLRCVDSRNDRPAIPAVLPGVHAVHAVDAAGVHPFAARIGSGRYVPYAGERCPQELLTNANAILGQGQLSLAKYLIIAAKEIRTAALTFMTSVAFIQHVLKRSPDWTSRPAFSDSHGRSIRSTTPSPA